MRRRARRGVKWLPQGKTHSPCPAASTACPWVALAGRPAQRPAALEHVPSAASPGARGPAARACPAVGAVTCVCGWLARACQPGGRGLAGAAPLVAGLGDVHAADPGEATGRVLMAPGGCPACLTGWGDSEPVLGWLPTLPAQAPHTPHCACPAGAGGWLRCSLPGGEPLLESALDLPSARPQGPCWCLWGPPPRRPHAPPVPLSVERPL